jgi:hypothetical protein
MSRRNLLDWQRETEERACAELEYDVIRPDWGTSDGVPRCTDECPMHDGKRCRALGMRPSAICEPAVMWMAKVLTSNETESLMRSAAPSTPKGDAP